jgi:IS1 family transposase
MVSMNRLTTEKRAQVIGMLVEGNSIRSTVRVTGVSKNTVAKLLADLGDACSAYMDENLRDLPCQRIQCDEIWAFVGMKAKNVPAERKGEFGVGDVWTWVALDADTKLVPSYYIGTREGADAYAFLGDLAKRLRYRVQLTTDSWRSYLMAVETTFGDQVDYAQIHKIFGPDPAAERRYSPPICTGITGRIVSGDPDPEHISTSYVERQNLTMRMGMRRFTRLTNAFSRKVENLTAAVSIHFFHYNFVRVHQTLKQTPAMAAGVSDHAWTLPEMIALLDATEKAPTKRGPYKKRAGSDSN